MKQFLKQLNALGGIYIIDDVDEHVIGFGVDEDPGASADSLLR